jgi:hypothetical protein
MAEEGETDPRQLTTAEFEKAALIALLKKTIAADPFPLSPRIQQLRSILAKLEPPPPWPQPSRSRLNPNSR